MTYHLYLLLQIKFNLILCLLQTENKIYWLSQCKSLVHAHLLKIMQLFHQEWPLCHPDLIKMSNKCHMWAFKIPRINSRKVLKISLVVMGHWPKELSKKKLIQVRVHLVPQERNHLSFLVFIRKAVGPIWSHHQKLYLLNSRRISQALQISWKGNRPMHHLKRNLNIYLKMKGFHLVCLKATFQISSKLYYLSTL